MMHITPTVFPRRNTVPGSSCPDSSNASTCIFTYRTTVPKKSSDSTWMLLTLKDSSMPFTQSWKPLKSSNLSCFFPHASSAKDRSTCFPLICQKVGRRATSVMSECTQKVMHRTLSAQETRSDSHRLQARISQSLLRKTSEKFPARGDAAVYLYMVRWLCPRLAFLAPVAAHKGGESRHFRKAPDPRFDQQPRGLALVKSLQRDRASSDRAGSGQHVAPQGERNLCVVQEASGQAVASPCRKCSEVPGWTGTEAGRAPLSPDGGGKAS